MPAKLTTEIFVQRARKVHDNAYDYTLVDYKNVHSKVEIICKKHGNFWQVARDHMKGIGCEKCGIDRRSSSSRLTLEMFIQSAQNVHGYLYDYSETKYTCSSEEVDIICHEHGLFSQIANNHLRSHGCPKCAIEYRAKKKTSDTEEFVKKAIKLHGNRYDYSSVVYIHNKLKVKIMCFDHGVFLQTPHEHLSGNGCRLCGQLLSGDSLLKTQPNVDSFLYILDMSYLTNYFFKLGISTNVSNRISQLKNQSGCEIGIVETFFGSRLQCWNTEQELLTSLKKSYSYNPETFFNGWKECLSVNPLTIEGVREKILAAGLKPCSEINVNAT